MADTEGGTVEQSTVLTEEEVQATLEETTEEVVDNTQLPSDATEFEVPDKFKGKSTEDVIKSYLELEKFKGDTKTEEGGDTKATEEKEEAPKEEDTKLEQETYQKYADALDKNGSLTEDEYAELEKAGYDKKQVDEEIEYRQYKKDKAMQSVLEPLGGGKEKFKEVSDWANQNKDKADLDAFNAELKTSGKLAQQALLKGLYAEFEASGTTETEPIHTNTPQRATSKGYTSEADFFKDLSSPDYSTHKSFAKAVEDKLSKTDTTGWAIG